MHDFFKVYILRSHIQKISYTNLSFINTMTYTKPHGNRKTNP